jgi:1-acyl-sn-glycerol-3-phosphate acyltransferase
MIESRNRTGLNINISRAPLFYNFTFYSEEFQVVMETNPAAKLLTVAQAFVDASRPGQRDPLQVTLDSAFETDLGLDSLSRAELISRVERAYDITFAEQVFAMAETPRDLLRALPQAASGTPAHLIEQIQVLSAPATDRIPAQADTFTSVLDWHVQAHPDRLHIHLYDRDEAVEQITYAGLRRGAEKVAAGLLARGLLPGQSVAIMLPTRMDYFYSFMGILLAGGIPVPLYPPARLTQIEDHLRRHLDILNNAQVQFLITIPEAQAIARLLKSRVASLRKVVGVDRLATAESARSWPQSKAADIAFLQYTSGSTGTPKGVVLTHANLLANIRIMAKTFQADSSDTFVSWLPLYHDMGLIGAWLSSLYCAIPLILMSPLAFLSRPSRWLWAIHKHRGTISAGPNFAFEYCLAKIDDAEIDGLDLSSWRLAVNGAEQVSPATIRRFQQRFGPYQFRAEAMTPSYGLAETSVGLAFPAWDQAPKFDRIQKDQFMRTRRALPAADDDADALSFVSCGQPLEAHQIQIVDAAGREVTEREEGRLLFKGPSCTSGYYRNPHDTAALFHGDWLDSGDLAYMAEGEVYLTGRSKDIIIRAGRNIHPTHLEEAVGNIEGLRKGCVAVFGSADPISGTERLVVLAETRETASAILASLRQEINAVVVDMLGAPPDDVVLAPPHKVLKTSSGKIRRAASRELYESGAIDKKQPAVWWQLVRLSWQAVMPQLRRLGQSAGALLYAGYMYVLLLFVAPTTWVTVVAAPGFAGAYRAMRFFAKALFYLARIPVNTHGLDHLTSTTHCIVVSNHCSYADSPILAAALPVQIRYVAKRELMHNVLSRLFLQRIGTRFVERFDSSKGTADARQVIKAARQGRSFIFFPEGTFDRMPGLQAFRMGAFLTAVQAGVPVVPVAIRGSRSLLRGDSWFPRRTAVSVKVSSPISPQGDDWDAAIRLRDAARAQILKYCGEPDLGG